MKLYFENIVKILAKDTKYTGYCYYTAGNPTWGGDAARRLHELGGAKGYVQFSDGNGKYYSPVIIYMFDSENTYIKFKQKLVDTQLDWFIKLDRYRDLPEDTFIIEED